MRRCYFGCSSHEQVSEGRVYERDEEQYTPVTSFTSNNEGGGHV